MPYLKSQINPHFLFNSLNSIYILSLKKDDRASDAIINLSGIMRYASRNAPCPIDKAQAKACKKMRKITLWIYVGSLMIYATGFFFAFIAPHLIG